LVDIALFNSFVGVMPSCANNIVALLRFDGIFDHLYAINVSNGGKPRIVICNKKAKSVGSVMFFIMRSQVHDTYFYVLPTHTEQPNGLRYRLAGGTR
jgi:hypothetical protein